MEKIRTQIEVMWQILVYNLNNKLDMHLEIKVLTETCHNHYAFIYYIYEKHA
jgi:hypothetical protein